MSRRSQRMRRVLEIVSGWFRRGSSEGARFFSPEDWIKLVETAPHDLRLRIELCRCLADFGYWREALEHVRDCRACVEAFDSSMHDRLLLVKTGCRLRDQAARLGYR